MADDLQITHCTSQSGILTDCILMVRCAGIVQAIVNIVMNVVQDKKSGTDAVTTWLDLMRSCEWFLFAVWYVVST